MNRNIILTLNFEDLIYNFRKELENYISDNNISIQGPGYPLESFPNGCCLSASLLLGNFLKDVGYRNIYLMSGNEGEHYWLEVDNIIVDITCDQFPNIEQRVIIIESNKSEFHLKYNTIKENLRKISKDHHFTNILRILKSKLIVNLEI